MMYRFPVGRGTRHVHAAIDLWFSFESCLTRVDTSDARGSSRKRRVPYRTHAYFLLIGFSVAGAVGGPFVIVTLADGFQALLLDGELLARLGSK
jgi:hypothetical protein